MRKIYILAIVMVCITTISKAQITKGSIYLGGSIGYSKTTETRTTTPPQTSRDGDMKFLAISPALGIAVKENIIVGINFSYGKSNQENINGVGSYENKVVGGGMFLRRYFPLAKKFYAFGELNAGYADVSSKQSSGFSSPNRNESKGWRIDATLYPGLSYNVTKAFYLEVGFADLFQLAYQKDKQTEFPGSGPSTYSTERKSFNVSSSLTNGTNLNIGVRFIIPKK